jgi:predicted ATPase/DNA-binding CsgD family transcriptional regulator
VAKRSHLAGNLPAETTSFVGRRRELAEIKRKLADARLVTLVGPGGVGKTRLAIHAAADLARGFRDGAWVVELAEVRDRELTGNAFAAALDLRAQTAAKPSDLVCAYLAEREVLLIVDNCEHLIGEAAAVVDAVIKAAPAVRVIATSREPLAVGGEHVVPLAPLELPEAELAEPLSRLRQNEAVALFCERAAAASGNFELDEKNRTAVVDVCRRLDGLPLAIELAAVRTRVLSLEQIVERLSDRFALLTRGARAALPRHQTLATTIDWSHDLLSAEERQLFRRLSVFAGRFALDDVEGVCQGDLDVLSSLIEKSLVIKEDASGLGACRLHETMREYARLKLNEAGEVQTLEERCTDYYVACARRLGLDTRFQLREWLKWADLEMDNMRSVIGRCIARGDYMRGIELVTAMGWAWITHATAEGVRWFDQLLVPPYRDSPEFGWSLFMRGFLSTIQGDARVATPWLDRAIAAARTSGDRALLVHALGMASVSARMAGDAEAAAALLAEGQRLVTTVDHPAATLAVLQSEAISAYFDGDLDGVRNATTTGIDLARRSGELYALEVMLGELAGTWLLTGEPEAARPLYVEGLRTARMIDDRVTQFYYVDALAALAAMSGDPRRAAQLLGASKAMQTAAGATSLAFMTPIASQAEESARTALGEAKFAAEFEAGKRMRRDAALDLAIGAHEQVAGKAGASTGGLGKREADVARLIAQGLTNKEIGVRLFISQRTVDTHVRSILNKLGFNTRAQIAAWVSAETIPRAHLM